MWTGLEIGVKGKTATEIFRDNFLGCFITDPAALFVRDRIGMGTIVVGVRLPALRHHLAAFARAVVGRAPRRRLL